MQQSHSSPTGSPHNWLFVPESICTDVLQWDHSSKHSCHPGHVWTPCFLQQQFWWPSMSQDTKSFIAACPVCAQGVIYLTTCWTLQSALHSKIPPVTHHYEFRYWASPAAGHTTIMTVVYWFSKKFHFIPFPKLPSAAWTGDLLVKHVFHLYGLPRDFLTKLRSTFVWKTFCNALGAMVNLSLGYHPQSALSEWPY